MITKITKNQILRKKNPLKYALECLYYFGLSTKDPTKFFSIRFAKEFVIFSVLATGKIKIK
jgi:hypothetical protein